MQITFILIQHTLLIDFSRYIELCIFNVDWLLTVLVAVFCKCKHILVLALHIPQTLDFLSVTIVSWQSKKCKLP